MHQRDRISPQLSAALNAARALAAVYVVLHHVTGARGWHVGIGKLFVFGQEAVLAFFLLSGFVIFANERTRALAPRGFYLRRVRRIYPALIVAMLVSTLVALDNHDLRERFSLAELIGTLAALQDNFFKPGVIVYPYLGNDPLWSLSYEIAFYLAFPFVLRAWHRAPGRTNHLVGAICCLAYVAYAALPNHFALVAAYFLVWWGGAMAADAYLRGGSSAPDFWPILAWLGALSAVAGATILIVGHAGFSSYPALPFRHFIVGLGMLLVFANRFGVLIARALARFGAPVAALASISYGLYVLHHPILVSWNRAHTAPGLVIASLLLIGTAWLGDRTLNAVLPRAPRA